ncbi:MAG: hypothetical protein N2Z23_09085 [Pyrinomonadaceae bacterium]|nr:hypothetical protein [Pyrinomonadaceae bacterium]MCX7640575.1 hypothetical protein [Pyrinomonadaceae bacterium]MDW8303844.1 hypothetical protein [Acidobacteriota bacterium]
MFSLLAFFLVLIFPKGPDTWHKSQELSEDGIPVIIKHLPDWKSVKDEAVLIKTKQELKEILGDRKVFEAFDFIAGAEAALATYPAGKLLIIEYNTPQLSIEADEQIKQKLSEVGDKKTLYRRIGNYNVFVFDVMDEKEAIALLDEVKYEKFVKWLGEDPFAREKIERAYGIFIGQMLLSTILAILLGLGTSAVLGVCVGMVVFHFREKQRKSWTKFSDAGGMVRLNLDELQEVSERKLLF